MAFLNGTDPGLRQTRTPTVDTFAAGVGFTAGSSTYVTLSVDCGTEASLITTFDGITQHRDTYSYDTSNRRVTFDAAIPTGVAKIECTYTTTIPATTPADGSVGTAQLADNGVSLAKLADGTQGQVLYYGASGAPTLLNHGTSGHFLKTQGSGANPVWAAAGGGKVLQVVQTAKTDVTSTTSTSATDISGMSVAITPAATSSKVLVQFNVQGSANPSSVQNWHIHLLRGSSAIFQGDAASSRTRCTLNGAGASGGTSGGESWRGSMSFLDSPSSTSELTYKLQWEVQGNTLYLNSEYGDSDDANTGRFVSSITAMEIGA